MPTLLVISQVYLPDPASAGQHIADVAAAMAQRGMRVVVFTSRRGYDDPSVTYPPRETIAGVDVRRLPWSSFGKRSIPIRLLGAASFLLQVFVRGLCMRRLRLVLVSTSPPMASCAALLIHALRRVPFVFWSMDVNPDQAVLLGRARANSPTTRVFAWVNRLVLARARRVIALDRFMAQRLERQQALGARLRVIPPWPHDEALEPGAGEPADFRRRHGLEGRFVFMYSGNHSPAHPLDTLVGAAARLHDRPDIVLVFVGGGLGKRVVEAAIQAGARNLVSLPYQPLHALGASLAAADVHLVAFGDAMVGVVHPCKAYGAMAVARPLLLVGPHASPTAEMIERHGIGWRVDHGDVDGAAALLRTIADTDAAHLRALGARARHTVQAEFAKPALCGALCNALEESSIAVPAATPAGPAH